MELANTETKLADDKKLDEPEIIVEGDEKPEAAAVAETKATPVAKEETAEEGISALKAQLQAQTERAAKAEREAAEARTNAQQAGIGQQDANLQLISNAMEQQKSQSEMYKQQLAAAWKEGDFDKAAGIQEKLSDTRAKLLTLENGKAALQQQLAQARKAPPAAADPVEQIARNLTPRSADWIRAHPEYVNDPQRNNRMRAAHHDALADGLVPDTDAYFAFVEGKLGLRKGERPIVEEKTDDDALSQAAAPAPKPKAPPAAPVSRAAGSQNGRATVRLSADEREIAEMMGLTPEKYAANKLALQREGKLN